MNCAKMSATSLHEEKLHKIPTYSDCGRGVSVEMMDDVVDEEVELVELEVVVVGKTIGGNLRVVVEVVDRSSSSPGISVMDAMVGVCV